MDISIKNRVSGEGIEVGDEEEYEIYFPYIWGKEVTFNIIGNGKESN